MDGSETGSHVDSAGFEQGEMSLAIIQQVTDDLWTITGAVAHDEAASESLGMLVCYVQSCLMGMPTHGDPELIALGFRDWVHEMGHLNGVTELDGEDSKAPG